jgi:hypothetical protein
VRDIKPDRNLALLAPCTIAAQIVVKSWLQAMLTRLRPKF